MFARMVALAAGVAFLSSAQASAQHLWWDTSKAKDGTCLYGEITVLATHEAIYYCGAQLASRRSSRRLLWNPTQSTQRAKNDLFDLGHISHLAPESHPGRTENDLRPVRQ